MKRRIFNFLTALSLAILVAIPILCWRDAQLGHIYSRPPTPHYFAAGFRWSCLRLDIGDCPPAYPADSFRYYVVFPAFYATSQAEPRSNPQHILIRHRAWGIHLSALALLLAILPFRWLLCRPVWKRRPQLFLLFLLLLLLVPPLATTFLWWRSYRHGSTSSSLTLYHFAPHHLDCSDSYGRIDFHYQICPDPSAKGFITSEWGWDYGLKAMSATRSYRPWRADGSQGPAVFSTDYVLYVPYWAATAVAAMLPLLLLPRLLRRARELKRLRLGLCLHCGYDLRASTERCPECGMAICREPVDTCDQAGKVQL